MKKQISLLVFLCGFCISALAQSANMGFRNDMNGGLFLVNYTRDSENLSNNTVENNGNIRFYNFNFRFGGSLIGTLIFDEDSRLFIGDYTQLGLGFGIGKNLDTTDVYAGTTFNLLLGCNFGAVAAYAISEELTVGIKVLIIGGDMYFDFDENPLFVNGLTFHPTAQYGNFLVSAGFGGRDVKGRPYKTLDLEARYHFSDDQETSPYVSLRYQSNKYAYDENNYRYSQKINTVGLSFGFFF